MVLIDRLWTGCRLRRLARSRGATLIELMIAVAIVGILAAVAVPALMEYIRESRLSEANANIQGILDAEQAFFVRNGRYTAALGFCPPALPPAGDTQLWPGPAELVDACGQGWMDLGWHPDMGVQFQYRVFSHFDPTDGDPFQINPTAASLGGAPPDEFGVDWATEGFAVDPIEPWCAVEAQADTDGDGKHIFLRSNSYNRKMFLAREVDGTW